MTIRQEVEQALVVLENHRDILEAAVVDTAVAALNDKLLVIQSPSPPDSQKQLVVLVADLSGFTAMSEMMDAEEVRDTINAIWKKLDNIIQAWGGKIDQHIGDAVVALFDLKSNISDCTERAVLAALDIQKELALFSETQRPETLYTTPKLNFSSIDLNLRMRIGIHFGSVVFGKVGSSLQYMAVGDTINIAKQLEQAAPIGGVLISDLVYDQIHQDFETEKISPVTLIEAPGRIQAFAVKCQKRHMLQDYKREVTPSETRFVGRSWELEQLQFALDIMVESGSAQVITVVGKDGVGKSRLRLEFEKYLSIQPNPIHLFKGNAKTTIAEGPYAVIQRTFANFFDIHARSNSWIAQANLIDGILGILPDEESHARERAHFIGYLLGFDLADSPYLQSFKHDARRIREYGFQDIALFFTAVTQERPTVILLDDMEEADISSLELLEYLVEVCGQRPLLIVCFASEDLPHKWSTLNLHHELQPETFQQINLDPLSLIDNRHLIANSLQSIPRLPLRLTDILAEAAGGHPFLIVEMIEQLEEIGVIIKGSQQWRVQMSPLNDLRGKLTLEWLVQKQLERLNPLEREILQKAAVVGERFWETAVFKIPFLANKNTTDRQVRAAIQNLERQEIIIQQNTSAFPQTREFQFRHKSWQQIAYNTLPPSQRYYFHTQCATWLLDQQATHLPNIFATIAAHLEKAGDAEAASTWYGRAADQASHNYTPALTISLYQKALAILPQTDQPTSGYNQLAEGLGEIMRQQGQFDAAIEIYSQMYQNAAADNDYDTAVRTFRNLFITHNFQGEHHSALKIAQEAEKIARHHNNNRELALALAAQGWAFTYLGDIQQAITCSKKALNLSTSAHAKREMAYCHGLIGSIARILRRFDQAQKATQKAIDLFREIGDRPWRVLMLHNLGQIAFQRLNYVDAKTHYSKGLKMARDIGDAFGAIRHLSGLGFIAQQQGQYSQAEQYAQKALLWAEKSGNIRFKTLAAVNLSKVHLAQHEMMETAVAQKQQLAQARHWLEEAKTLNDGGQNWLLRVILQVEIARLLLAEEKPAKALTQIQATLKLIREENVEAQGFHAQKTSAIAWRELANIAAQMPPTSLPIYINTKPYQIAECYQKSLEILTPFKYGTRLEIAHTLFAWAVYEIRADHHERGETLWQQAHTLYSQLGLTKEIAKMERFVL